MTPSLGVGGWRFQQYPKERCHPIFLYFSLAIQLIIPNMLDSKPITIENSHIPAKRRQALLGSNLPRDSRVQVALNNAAEGNSSENGLFPSPSLRLLFKLSC